MSDAIVRLPIRAEVRERVARRIVTGSLAGGKPINLASLARELAVSVTPLREALIELESDGFVEAYQGRGFLVRPLDAAEVNDIYPLIWTLEMLALRSSPEFSAAQLRELEQINADLEHQDDPFHALRLDSLWHEALLSGCTNRTLHETLKALKQRARRYEYGYMKESGQRVSTMQHTGIIHELRRGDRPAATELLQENWSIGPKFLLPWLESQKSKQRKPRSVGDR